jgi:hypothetical protein
MCLNDLPTSLIIHIQFLIQNKYNYKWNLKEPKRGVGALEKGLLADRPKVLLVVKGSK